MKVRVRLSSLLRQATNWQETFDVEAHTPEACLRSLEARFPDLRRWMYDQEGKMWDRLQIFLNGKRIGLDGLSTPMQEGDELYVLLNIGGG